eukprot:160133-Hanusia_phi.AAC.1
MSKSLKFLFTLVAVAAMNVRSTFCFQFSRIAKNAFEGIRASVPPSSCEQRPAFRLALPLGCDRRPSSSANVLICSVHSGKEESVLKKQDLHVYTFVTMVGWGKNTFLNELFAIDAISCDRYFGQPTAPIILESDEIGKDQFWSAVQETIKGGGADLRHLILNKNFPPNSWKGTVDRLKMICNERNRSLCLHAVVPTSLFEFALCLYAVRNRKEHPNLSASAKNVPEVVTLFYNLYDVQGGHDAPNLYDDLSGSKQIVRRKSRKISTGRLAIVAVALQ